MISIELQFLLIEKDGEKFYKPISKMSQLICVIRKIDYFNQQLIDNFERQGYRIMIDRNESIR